MISVNVLITDHINLITLLGNLLTVISWHEALFTRFVIVAENDDTINK